MTLYNNEGTLSSSCSIQMGISLKKTLKTESETYHLEKNGQQRRKIKRMGQMSEIDQICYKMSESRSSIAVPVHLDLDITCWSFTSF